MQVDPRSCQCLDSWAGLGVAHSLTRPFCWSHLQESRSRRRASQRAWVSLRGRSGKGCDLNSGDGVECREALASADVSPFLRGAGRGPNPPCIPAPGAGRVLGEAREVFAQLME